MFSTVPKTQKNGFTFTFLTTIDQHTKRYQVGQGSLSMSAGHTWSTWTRLVWSWWHGGLSEDAGEQASSVIKSSSTQSSVISHPSSYSEKAAKNEYTYHISTKKSKNHQKCHGSDYPELALFLVTLVSSSIWPSMPHSQLCLALEGLPPPQA